MSKKDSEKSKKILKDKIEALLVLCEVYFYKNDTDLDSILMQCPFHGDKLPSMRIDIANRRYTCFSSSCKSRGKLEYLLSHISGMENYAIAEYLNDPTKFLLEHLKDKELKIIDTYYIRSRCTNCGKDSFTFGIPKGTTFHKFAENQKCSYCGCVGSFKGQFSW